MPKGSSSIRLARSSPCKRARSSPDVSPRFAGRTFSVEAPSSPEAHRSSGMICSPRNGPRRPLGLANGRGVVPIEWAANGSSWPSRSGLWRPSRQPCCCRSGSGTARQRCRGEGDVARKRPFVSRSLSRLLLEPGTSRHGMIVSHRRSSCWSAMPEGVLRVPRWPGEH